MAFARGFDETVTQQPERRIRGAWRRAAACATQAEGAISLAQLRECGITESQRRTALRTGRLFRRGRGVYLLGHEFATQRAKVFLALLRAGPGAVLSDRSAASAMGLLSWQGPIHVTVPGDRRKQRGIVRHIRRLDRRREVVHRHDWPMTTFVRTVVDCAATLPAPVLEVLIAEAGYRGMLSRQNVAAIRASVARRPGAKALTRLLDAREPGRGKPKSWLEKRWARFARDWELPPYARGSHVDIGGMELRESDVVFDGRPLRIVELDAFGTHERTQDTFERDRRRDRRLLARGGLTMRVTESDFRDEAELAEDVLRFVGHETRADAVARGTWRPRIRRSRR